MKRSSRAWILLPAFIIVAAVAGIIVSNYQKEAGLGAPGKGGVAAVAAAADAMSLATGSGADDLLAFSRALVVAEVARKNAPHVNPADTRLDHLLIELLDCLTAAREAWQAQVNGDWDEQAQGSPTLWGVMHPALSVPTTGALTAEDIRRLAYERATQLLLEATELAG